MAADEPYEIRPYTDVVELKKQIADLERGAEDPVYRELFQSMDSLTKSMNNMMQLFSSAAEEMELEEKTGSELSQKIVPFTEDLNRLEEQNRTLAEGLVAIASMIKDIMKGRMAEEASKPSPPPMPPEEPKLPSEHPRPQIRPRGVRYVRARPRYAPAKPISRGPPPKLIMGIPRKEFILIASIVLTSIAILIMLIPFPYTAIDYYMENESYIDAGPSTGEGSSLDGQCYLKDPTYKRVVESEWINNTYARVSCILTNFENVPVTFNYEITADYSEDYMNEDAMFRDGPYDATVEAGKTKSFNAEFKIAESQFWYACVVFPYSIEICNSTTVVREAEEQEIVTKYREVQKEREVRKWASLLRRWLS